MGRARNIKPSFFENESLAEFEPWVRLLFIGLWTVADREGRFEVRPKRLRATLFPYDDFAADIADAIARLAAAGFLTLYRSEPGGPLYAEIANWAKHQRPHHKEAESVIPPSMGQASVMDEASMTTKASASRADSLIPDTGYRIPDTGYPVARKRAPIVVPDWLSGEVWGRWEQFRKRKSGKGWTEDAARLSLRTLEKLRDAGHDPETVINQSIERGWTGLFEIGGKGYAGPGTGKSVADRVADAVRASVERSNR